MVVNRSQQFILADDGTSTTEGMHSDDGQATERLHVDDTTISVRLQITTTNGLRGDADPTARMLLMTSRC